MIAILLRIGATLGTRLLPFLLPLFGFVPSLFKAVTSKDFLKKNGKIIFLVVGGIVAYIIYNRWQNSRSLEDVAGSDSNSKRAYVAASVIADYLGTHKDSRWFQISSWYEDEKKATETILANRDILKLVETKYLDISGGRALRDDIGKFYNSKQKKELFKSIGWYHETEE